MRILTVRLPEALVAEIEEEARERGVPKSIVLRDRLRGPRRRGPARGGPPAAIADLVGSVRGLPPGLSGRRKDSLRSTGYGRPRPR